MMSVHLILSLQSTFLTRLIKELDAVSGSLQVQGKFRLDLSDEEAVHYIQSLIDESVHTLFAAVVEQIHKFAQVRSQRLSELSGLWA